MRLLIVCAVLIYRRPVAVIVREQRGGASPRGERCQCAGVQHDALDRDASATAPPRGSLLQLLDSTLSIATLCARTRCEHA